MLLKCVLCIQESPFIKSYGLKDTFVLDNAHDQNDLHTLLYKSHIYFL